MHVTIYPRTRTTFDFMHSTLSRKRQTSNKKSKRGKKYSFSIPRFSAVKNWSNAGRENRGESDCLDRSFASHRLAKSNERDDQSRGIVQMYNNTPALHSRYPPLPVGTAVSTGHERLPRTRGERERERSTWKLGKWSGRRSEEDKGRETTRRES